MNKQATFKVLCRWVLVAYMSLVIEQFCFLGSFNLAVLPGENHISVGYFLINALVLPFLPLTLIQGGGTLVAIAMVAFALSSYSLRFKMPWNSLAIACGLTALLLAVIWDIDKLHGNTKQFWLILVGQILAVGLVFMLGIYSDMIFTRKNAEA